jgi:hypothetical protein
MLLTMLALHDFGRRFGRAHPRKLRQQQTIGPTLAVSGRSKLAAAGRGIPDGIYQRRTFRAVRVADLIGVHYSPRMTLTVI